MHPKIVRLISESRDSALLIDRRMKEYADAADARLREFEAITIPNLRPAIRRDYEDWLRQFLDAGGEPTHYYDYQWGGVAYRGDKGWQPQWYVAVRDFRTVALHGSSAVQIIAPEPVKWLGGELGHCNVYQGTDLPASRRWVPVYADLEV